MGYGKQADQALLQKVSVLDLVLVFGFLQAIEAE